MRHALPANAEVSLYSPISLERVLRAPEEEDHTRVLIGWALALVASVVLGVALQHLGGVGPTVRIMGSEGVVGLAPPTLLFGLVTLWLGLEWGYLGAFFSGALLLWYAGLPAHTAALQAMFDALALVPLAVSFRVAPVSTALRDPFAWTFFLVVSLLSALLGSTGELLAVLASGEVEATLPAWHGGWVGPFCQLVAITGPLLVLLSPAVGRWKAERGLVSPWSPPDQGLLGTALLAGAGLISLFMLGSRKMAADALADALTMGPALPEAQGRAVLEAFRALDIIPALSVTLMACAALSLFRLIVSWTSSARTTAAALRASEARMTALVDAIPDLVLRFRADGTVLDLKDGLGLLGQGDRVGQSITEFWPSRVAHPLMGRAEDALTYGTSVVEFRLESDQGLRDYEARIVATGKEDVVAIVRDVTQQRELVRVKAELVQAIGQALRAPVNSVQGTLALIRAGSAGAVPSKVEQLVNLAWRHTERLVLLADEVQAMAPRQTGDTSLFLEPVSLAALVQASVAGARGVGRQARVMVDLLARDEEAEVLGDPDRISMVLDALLSNALKFSPARGRVEVSLVHLPEAWRVQVRDEGCGIPEAFRPRVFRTQGRAEGRPGSELARARDVVLQLGGRIGFESRVGRGSTFWFELPELARGDRPERGRAERRPGGGNLAAAGLPGLLGAGGGEHLSAETGPPGSSLEAPQRVQAPAAGRSTTSPSAVAALRRQLLLTDEEEDSLQPPSAPPGAEPLEDEEERLTQDPRSEG